MTDAIVALLDREQALDCGRRFREGINSAHSAVLEFYEGAGWIALGYASFEAAAMPIFGYSFQYLYKIKDAAVVERNLALPSPSSTPLTDTPHVGVGVQSGASGGSATPPPAPTPPTIPVDHAQALKTLPDPRDQQRAYELATTVAADANRKVTKGDVQQAVKAIKDEGQEADRKAVYAAGFSPLIQKMNQGGLTPAAARQIADALAACEPVVRGEMLRLEIIQPTIIREINRLYLKGRESYLELVRSGTLQFADASYVPLTKANPRQLEAYLKERRDEHLAAGRELRTGRVQWAGRLIEIDPEQRTVTFQAPLDDDILRRLKLGRSFLLDLAWDETREKEGV